MAHHDISTKNGVIRVTALTAHSFRVRLSRTGDFTEPALTRYCILKNDVSIDAAVRTEGGATIIDAGGATLCIDDRGISLSLNGRVRWECTSLWSGTDDGWGGQCTLTKDEKLYGMGDVTRERIQKRGFRTVMWVKNVASYVPIPFLMSTNGWAMLLNTTWKHYIDAGYKDNDALRFWGRRGELDIFLFAGVTLPELLDRYTFIAGRPKLLPLWAYGLTFVCNQQANAREMVDDCLNLRREGIPCDVIGLEPGWMSKYYDYSIDKDWHPERFAIPSWVRKQGDVSGGNDQTFMGAARRLGFKVSLWLCSDYDLSFEEERRAQGDIDTSRLEVKAEKRSEDDFEQDQNFGHGPTLMDKLTKPEIPWFEHLKKFVDDGASAFKLDGALQVNEHPDRKWGNGMDDEEMHNLYPAILNKQMHNGFVDHTKHRSMVYSSGGYTGIQQFSATWAGDTGGGPKPLISMINHGMSGHVNTSCDMDVFTPAGIHFGFLQPWSQVCSWAYWRHPWLLGDTLLPIFKFYASLRYRLIPYIYSMAHIAERTGMPILRGMPLAFPDDPAGDSLINQYLFGDAFLVAAFTDKMHLPEGQWMDLWTGVMHTGPKDIVCEVPKERGGPLFIRAGAIIPQYPLMDHVGQRSVETVTVDVYPSGESSFTMYEDDGISYQYRDGKISVTEMRCSMTESAITVTIEPRKGDYDGMPKARQYAVVMHIDERPRAVAVNGKETAADAYAYDETKGELVVVAPEDASRSTPLTVIALL